MVHYAKKAAMIVEAVTAYFSRLRASTSVAERIWKYVTHSARPIAVSQAAIVVIVIDMITPCTHQQCENLRECERTGANKPLLRTPIQ
eukprot:365864-Chlamydomonas_euryale.AAC.8